MIWLSIEIKNGHRIRDPSDNTNYCSQIKKIYVDGYHEENENVAESRGIEKTEEYVRGFSKKLEGDIG